MTLLYYILGSLTTCFIASLIYRYKIKKLTMPEKPKDESPKYLRRGIYRPIIFDNEDEYKPVQLNVICEIGEVERTDNKSKIEVIDYVIKTHGTNKSQRIVDLSEGWVESRDVEWFKLKNTKRNNAIDNLLEEE